MMTLTQVPYGVHRVVYRLSFPESDSRSSFQREWPGAYNLIPRATLFHLLMQLITDAVVGGAPPDEAREAVVQWFEKYAPGEVLPE